MAALDLVLALVALLIPASEQILQYLLIIVSDLTEDGGIISKLQEGRTHFLHETHT